MFQVCSIEDVSKAVKAEFDSYAQNTLKKALADLRTQIRQGLKQDLLTFGLALGDAGAGNGGLSNVGEGHAVTATQRRKNRKSRRPKRGQTAFYEEDDPGSPKGPQLTFQTQEHEGQENPAMAKPEVENPWQRQNSAELALLLEATGTDSISDLNPSYFRVNFADPRVFVREETGENLEGGLEMQRTSGFSANVLTCQERLKSAVEHPVFEPVCGIVVLANAVFMGLDVSVLDPEASGSVVVEFAFFIIFLSELMIRLMSRGLSKFYFGNSWKWAWFDTFIVSLQLVDQCSVFISEAGVSMQIGTVSSLRVLRLLRILRLTRIFHLFPVLSLVSNAMTSSLPTTLYSLSVFVLMVYGFSVVFVQAMNEPCKYSEALDEYFGTLTRTGFTLLASISGGIGWEDVLIRILEGAYPALGLVFVLYLALTSACCLSMALGVVIDSLTRVVREDKDTILADRVNELFTDESVTDAKGELRWVDFAAKLEHPVMNEYFKVIDVSPTPEDAKYVFELLDEDGSGTLSQKEMVNGCLRLRGPARSLDMAIVLRDIAALSKDVDQVLQQSIKIFDELNATQTVVRAQSLNRFGASTDS